ncbi:hypothetical protein P3T76_002248 [Phytophthora citrophthora]|uniref:Uncharacterized protein n=1 Tax=Phytophthora citrophthora TaxID=4793 RepID=A0AAD9GZB1_9STRA|nr:hypothetical protein P3T76_002248 [Phytophthora citrophthora]
MHQWLHTISGLAQRASRWIAVTRRTVQIYPQRRLIPYYCLLERAICTSKCPSLRSQAPPKTNLWTIESSLGPKLVRCERRDSNFATLRQERQTLQQQQVDLSSELSSLQQKREAERKSRVENLGLAVWKAIAIREKENESCRCKSDDNFEKR